MEKLDHKLSSMLLKAFPTGGFQGLQCENTPERGTTTVQLLIQNFTLKNIKHQRSLNFILGFQECISKDREDLKLFADAFYHKLYVVDRNSVTTLLQFE